MSMNMFCKSIVDYINTCDRVTVFQVMVETHQSYADVVSTFDNCVQRGILVTCDGEMYVVVPRNSRLPLKDKMVRKVTAILEALTEEEIHYLLEATENNTRSRVGEFCAEHHADFEKFAKHLVEIHLFEKVKQEYILALSEEEYHFFWKQLGNYPLKERKSK